MPTLDAANTRCMGGYALVNVTADYALAPGWTRRTRLRAKNMRFSSADMLRKNDGSGDTRLIRRRSLV